MGRGINKAGVWGKEICGPDAAVPMVCEDLFVAVDELI